MAKLDERRKVFLAIAIVFCVAMLVQFIYQWYNSHHTKQACNLAKGGCTVAIGQQGSVSLKITPQQISPDSRVALQVNIKNIPVQTVIVDIINGTNPSCATQTLLSQDSDNSYSATGTVPNCAVTTNRWLFLVRAQNGPNAYAIPFRLAQENSE